MEKKRCGYEVIFDHETNGFRVVCARMDLGHLCGYIAIPKGSIFYGMPYSTIDELVSIHGGFTFADKNDGYPVSSSADVWWIGFDCAHAGDNNVACDAEYVENELMKATCEILKQEKSDTIEKKIVLLRDQFNKIRTMLDEFEVALQSQ